MAYRVTAPYVTVQVTAVPGGPFTTLGFYAGAILPDNVDRDSAETQVRKGLVEKVSADEVPATEEPTETDPETPAGPQRPAKNAAKAAWVAFAVNQRGEDVDEDTARADAETLTQTQLVAKYGS